MTTALQAAEAQYPTDGTRHTTELQSAFALGWASARSELGSQAARTRWALATPEQRAEHAAKMRAARVTKRVNADGTTTHRFMARTSAALPWESMDALPLDLPTAASN